MKIDLKLVFLALVVLCLVSEIDGWGRRSGGRSRSVRSGRRSVGRSYRGGVRRSYRRRRYRRSVRRSYRRRRYRRSVRRSHRGRRYRRSVRRSHRRRRYRRSVRRSHRRRRYRRSVRRSHRRRRYRRSVRRSHRRRRKRKGWFSKSGRKIKAIPPHKIKTQQGLTKLYNSEVIRVERVKRPLKGFLGKIGFKHSGVVVTTKSGKRWLVHKGAGYGTSGQTVVTDANNMGKKWRVEKYKKVTGATVGDYVKTGGKKYRVLTDNCHHASHRMYKNKG